MKLRIYVFVNGSRLKMGVSRFNGAYDQVIRPFRRLTPQISRQWARDDQVKPSQRQYKHWSSEKKMNHSDSGVCQLPSVTQWNRSYDQLGWRPIDGAHVQLAPCGPIISNDFWLPLPHSITNSRRDRIQYIATGTPLLPEDPNDRIMAWFGSDISCHGSSRSPTKVTSFSVIDGFSNGSWRISFNCRGSFHPHHFRFFIKNRTIRNEWWICVRRFVYVTIGGRWNELEQIARGVVLSLLGQSHLLRI